MKLQDKFKILPEGFIALLLLDSVKYAQTTLETLKIYLTKEKNNVIYVAFNRPYDNLIKILEQNKIGTEKIFFIDAITLTAGGLPLRKERVLFISSPQNLTDLSIALSEVMNAFKTGGNFLFFDSITTLLVYNTSETVEKFSHFLISRMRLGNVKGIFLAVEEETNERLIRTLSQFMDKTIRIKGE